MSALVDFRQLWRFCLSTSLLHFTKRIPWLWYDVKTIEMEDRSIDFAAKAQKPFVKKEPKKEKVIILIQDCAEELNTILKKTLCPGVLVAKLTGTVLL